MKTYAVRVNQDECLVELIAFESRAVESGKLTFQQIAGKGCDLWKVSTNKNKCIEFMSKYFLAEDRWIHKDISDETYDQFDFSHNQMHK